MEQFPSAEQAPAKAEMSKRSEILAQLSIIEQNIDNIKRMLEDNPSDEGLQQQLRDGKQYRKMGMGALYDLADAERIAAQNIGDTKAAATTTDSNTLGQKPSGIAYVDSQGILHSDPASAQANEPDNWRIPNQQ
ncbi:hypothetical protein IJJ37_03140 [Candidatus Saccharibacteria bacterium]|nr:hypothetical protein [Candidatus Saccharibacteria bacterium]